jgi:hypothetical protein
MVSDSYQFALVTITQIILPLFVNPRPLQASCKLGCFHTIPENVQFFANYSCKEELISF